MAERPLVHVVDDDEALRDSLRLALEGAGYECRVHESGVAFLAAPFDPALGVALVDVRMPGLDGLELPRALKARGVRLPVIFMTGHGDVPLAVAAMKGGAADFVEKPCDFRSLAAAIERAL
ncbi:MAG: response regulator, partial [Hyphomicrobiales bacterium]|nr:response regulator [Hyphomicrobiales bacterium]